MTGVYDHLLSKEFRFHYHSQKVIGSLGIYTSRFQSGTPRGPKKHFHNRPFSHNHDSVEHDPKWKETNIGDRSIFHWTMIVVWKECTPISITLIKPLLISTFQAKINPSWGKTFRVLPWIYRFFYISLQHEFRTITRDAAAPHLPG